jgi:hypothetical protein
LGKGDGKTKEDLQTSFSKRRNLSVVVALAKGHLERVEQQ